MTALLVSARSIHFASLMAIFGGSAYAALLRRAGLLESPPKSMRKLFVTSALLAVVSGLVWFCLIAGQMSGSWQGSLDPAVLRLAASATRFGQIFLGRLTGLAVLVLLCSLSKSSDSLAIPILTGLILAALGRVSHAAASTSDIISFGAITDAAHLLTAAFWLGGLMALAIFLRRHWGDRDSMLAALQVFSTRGSVAVAVLVISGVINATSILPVSQMSLHNWYFELLVLKVAPALVMVGLASLNRWRFAPSLRTDAELASQHLKVSVRIEIALGLLIVAITGLLGITPPH